MESDAKAPEKLRKLAQIFEAGLKKQRPCLIAALGGGANTLPETAVAEPGGTTRGAVARFTSIFESSVAEESLKLSGKPSDAAMGFFAMLQGLQVLVRASGNTAGFRAAVNAHIDSITRS